MKLEHAGWIVANLIALACVALNYYRDRKLRKVFRLLDALTALEAAEAAGAGPATHVGARVAAFERPDVQAIVDDWYADLDRAAGPKMSGSTAPVDTRA